MGFTRAKQNRIFQDIVQQIQQAIVRGELVAGEKLPPERELCTIFSTSRGTLREALRILEQKKLISIKLGAGGGAIVREANSELIAENLFLLLENGRVTRRHLVALTAELAAQVATLAATMAGKKDVGPLKQLVATLTNLLEEQNGNRELPVSMDSLLFAELAGIGANPLYGFLLQAALATIGKFTGKDTEMNNARQTRHYQQIRMIVYAVARNDRQQAHQLAQKHILELTPSPHA